MITIEHVGNGGAVVSGTKYMKDVLYACGDTKPNYPMPAIRICIWCGLDCMNRPIHELKCITQGTKGLQCNKLHLYQ